MSCLRRARRHEHQTEIVNCCRPFEPFSSDFLMDDRKAGARVWAREKRLLPPSSFCFFVCFSSCINSLTVRQHLVHAASRTFSSHNLIDLSMFSPIVSLDGRQMASIAVYSPHVSLCRLTKPAAKVGRRCMQNPRSPGVMRARNLYVR